VAGGLLVQQDKQAIAAAHAHHLGILEGSPGIPVVGSFGASVEGKGASLMQQAIEGGGNAESRLKATSRGSDVVPRPPGQPSQPVASTAAHGAAADSPVIRAFFESLKDPSCAIAVAAIQALTTVIEKSKASTIMELQTELNQGAELLRLCHPTAISLKAGCELFLRYVARTSALEFRDLSKTRVKLIARGRAFADISHAARHTLAQHGKRFITDGATVLVHGYSRVVLTLLKAAALDARRFSVVCTEGRPDSTGAQMARELRALGVPVTMILDSAMAYKLGDCSMVLVGAEGVVESGGIINKLGTYQAALLAKALNIPFYSAAESYKFTRIYPLGQRDFAPEPKAVDLGPTLPLDVEIDNPSRDYTPPHLISLLFTDLGVLTPAAVSDELIQLYL